MQGIKTKMPGMRDSYTQQSRLWSMEIVDLGAQPENLPQAAAAMLVEDFDAPAGWPDLSLAHQKLPTFLSMVSRVHCSIPALSSAGSVDCQSTAGVFGNCIQSLYKEVIDGKG
jgi:hypothetical protein